MKQTTEKSGEAIRLLFVEDNPGDAFFVKRSLLEVGEDRFAFTHVECLREALKCLEAGEYDLVLSDLLLPDSAGYEGLLALRRRACGAPIVVLTGLNDEGLALELARIGVQDYLVKDQVSGLLLRRTLYYAIERAQLLKKLCQREAQLQAMNQQLQAQVEVCTDELGQINHQLQFFQTLSSTDGLTKLANRHYFEEFFELEWRRSLRNGAPISVILIDIDQFKRFNDTYGHQRGDDCLRKVSQVLQGCVKRPRDLVARYGGEEFIVVLPDTPKLGATKVAELIGYGVGGLGIAHGGSSVSDQVTVSLGVATLIPKLGTERLELIAEADRALYLAKHEGRNRLAYFHSTSSVTEFSELALSGCYGLGEVHPFQD